MSQTAVAVTMSSIVTLAAVAPVAADIITLTSGATLSANGRTILSLGQPLIGLSAAQPSGTPSAHLGFIPAAGAANCPADFNNSGGPPTVQDIFDFLAAYFTLDPRADFNGVGGITVQDIFDFLAAYFTSCP